jgi:hypothetical protein
MIWPELHGDMQSLARAKPPGTFIKKVLGHVRHLVE